MASGARDRVDDDSRAQLPLGMESRDEAVNYFAWQASLFREIARGRIIDHGAGTGGLGAALLDAGASDVVAIEPNAELLDVLRRRLGNRTGASVFAGTLDDYLEKEGPGTAGCIVSSNVIEHIEDDVGCLRAMFEVLRPGGGVGLYVPARPELFGSLDRAVGHLRRYDIPDIDRKLRSAGFEVRSVHYRNLVGVLPWLLSGRILKRSAVSSESIRFFDRFVFPVCRRMEDLVTPRYGLNIAAIGVKP